MFSVNHPNPKVKSFIYSVAVSSPNFVYLMGSWYFDTVNANSDVDLYMEHNIKTSQFVRQLNGIVKIYDEYKSYKKNGSQKTKEVYEVYIDNVKINIILTDNVKSRQLAYQTAKRNGLGAVIRHLKDTEKVKHELTFPLWETLVEFANKAILKGDSPEAEYWEF